MPRDHQLRDLNLAPPQLQNIALSQFIPTFICGVIVNREPKRLHIERVLLKILQILLGLVNGVVIDPILIVLVKDARYKLSLVDNLLLFMLNFHR